jgi:hypothetical protein
MRSVRRVIQVVPGWGPRVPRNSGAVLEAPALVAGLDDFAVMREPVEQSRGHLGVAEHAGPFAEGEVSGNNHRTLLVEPETALSILLSFVPVSANGVWRRDFGADWLFLQAPFPLPATAPGSERDVLVLPDVRPDGVTVHASALGHFGERR